MGRNLNATAYGDYSITTTAGTLFSFANAGSPSSLTAGLRCFKGRVETNDIRVRMDSTNPTGASNGELVSAGDDILLDEAQLRSSRMRSVTGTAQLRGHFYSVEAAVFLGS